MWGPRTRKPQGRRNPLAPKDYSPQHAQRHLPSRSAQRACAVATRSADWVRAVQPRAAGLGVALRWRGLAAAGQLDIPRRAGECGERGRRRLAGSVEPRAYTCPSGGVAGAAVERPTDGQTGQTRGEAPPAAGRAVGPDLAGPRVGWGAGRGLWRCGCGACGAAAGLGPACCCAPASPSGAGAASQCGQRECGPAAPEPESWGLEPEYIPPPQQLRAVLQKPHLRRGGGTTVLFLFSFPRARLSCGLFLRCKL